MKLKDSAKSAQEALYFSAAVRELRESIDAPLTARGRDVRIENLRMVRGDGGCEDLVFRVTGSTGNVYEVRTFVDEELRQPSTALNAQPLLGTWISEDDFWDEDCLILDIECPCPYFESYRQCKHAAACLAYLERELLKKTPQEVAQWMMGLAPRPTATGTAWLSKLDAVFKFAELRRSQAVTDRLQWRLALGDHRSGIGMTAYEQQATATGGWTRGKLLRSTAIHQRMAASTDLQERELLRGLFGGGAANALTLIKFLVNRPVAWNDNPQQDVTVQQSTAVLRLVAHEEHTRVACFVGEDELLGNPDVRVYLQPTWQDSKCFIVCDTKRHRISVVDLNDTAYEVVRSFLQQAQQGPVLFDQNSAKKLLDQAERLGNVIPFELPEHLGGPEQPASTESVLILEPRQPAGLSLTLRVQPNGDVGEELVPGVGHHRVRGITVDGPVQWMRNLAAETVEADRLVNLLGVASYDYSGPYQWSLTTDEQALTFLERLQSLGDAAPESRWAGNAPQMQYVGEIVPNSLRIQIDDQRDWFGITGTVKVGDLEIPLIALLAALRGGRQYVPLGQGQFARITDELRRRLQSLVDAAPQDRNSLHVARAAVPLVEEVLGKDIPVSAAKGWHDTLRRVNRLRGVEPKLPPGFKAELRGYQLEGFQWLSRLSQWGAGACLADDMGLGKTVQALAVLQQRAAAGPALIVAPTSVGDNWVRESSRFTPKLKPHLYREHDREQLIKDAGPRDMVVVSYQLLQRDAERFASREWNTLVLDEAQFVKNAATKTAAAVRAIDANWRLALTGTPMENHLGELWSLYRTVSPGLLGSWDRFRRDFGDPIQKHQDAERRDAMGQVLKPFLLRRTKNAVLKELPDRTEIVRIAELSDPERKRYDAARLAALAELTANADDRRETDAQKRVRILSWLTKLRQLSCHPGLVDPKWKKSSAKLDLFLEIVNELREGNHRALVFSQFVQHLQLVKKALDDMGITYQYLDGSTPAGDRQRRVDAFQQGEGELFLISLKAGGTGLNLTAADYVVHLDPWWNPAVEDQATDRAHRIGQTRPVTVYRVVAQNTIEEQILSLHAKKRELVASVLDGTDTAAKLSTDELISMIRKG